MVAQRGSHIQFKHPTKKGRVTVPHPKREIPIGTYKNILKQAEIKIWYKLIDTNMTKKLTYVAVVYKEENSDYGVSFPDFKGCITAGITLEEALKEANEVLQFHVDGMLEDREELPKATSVDKIRGDNPDAISFFLVQVKVKEKAVRVNITIDEGLLRKLDKYTKEHKVDRSSFISNVISGAI